MHGGFPVSLRTCSASWTVTCAVTQGPSLKNTPHLVYCSTASPSNFWKTILPLNLGFVKKVWWDCGTWTWAGEVHQAAVWTCAGSGLGALQVGPGTAWLAWQPSTYSQSGTVWGNWGAQTHGSDSGYSSRDSTAMSKRRGYSRKPHWLMVGGWPGSLAPHRNCARTNSPDCTVTAASDT